MSNFVEIYGQPGGRARLSGLLRAAIPLCAVLLLCGYAIGALLPWPEIGMGWKSALIAASALAILLSAAFTGKMIDSFFKGASGEMAVAYVLARLPGGYTVFHGVDISGKNGLLKTHDFDHIVLTPSELIIVETKNWHGKLAFEDNVISIDGITPSRHPVKQVTDEAASLSAWLSSKIQDQICVTPILCFTGDTLPPDAPLEIDGVRLCNSKTINSAIVVKSDSKSPMSVHAYNRLSLLLREQV